MLVTVVSYHEDRRPLLPPDWDRFDTTEPIVPTYRALAVKAIDEGWDLDRLVIQDDVRVVKPIEPAKTKHVTAFVPPGQNPTHLCPHAFLATPHGWERLARAWLASDDSLCSAFLYVVNRIGRRRDGVILI